MPNAMKPILAPDLLNDLQDPTGKPIAIGSRVRSFDFPFAYRKAGEALGTDMDGQLANFMEGTVIAIGEMIEGCERYRIAVDKVVRAGVIQDISQANSPMHATPPTNGTKHAAGGVTAGVYLIGAT